MIGPVGDPTIPDDVARHTRGLGPLESPAIWVSVAVAAVVLVVVAVRLRQRRRGRRRAVVAAVLCVLLAAVTGINSYAGYIRTVDDLSRVLQRAGGPARALGQLLDDGKNKPRDAVSRRKDLVNLGNPAGTTIERIGIADPAHGIPSGTTYILLPPGYSDPANATRRYPVVYLVHGYPYGGPEDWLTAGDAPTTLQLLYGDQAIAPMIVVSVDLTAGQPSRDWEGLDVPGGPHLESYLTGTVTREIDQRYRTIADRTARALGGMSGGGFAALNIGLRHTEQFSGLVIALPYDTLGDDTSLLGGNTRLVKANTPRDYLPTMPFPHPVAAMLAVGTGAPGDVATAPHTADAFHARGQNAVVHAEHGFNHTWHTARATLPYLLVFADRLFRQGGPG
jgi:hypothetical protein